MRLTLLCIILLFSSTIDAKSNWRLVKNQDDVRVYSQNVPNLGKALRGSMTINGTISSVLAVIEDINSYPKWMHNCYSAKEVRKIDSNQSINYIAINMPWPVKDRDIVIQSVRTQNKQNKSVEVKFNATSGVLKKVKGKVRITKMSGSWLLTPVKNGKVKIDYTVSINPGNKIPKWIVNALAVDLPFNTLRNLRKVTKNQKYQVAKIYGIVN